MNAPEQPTPTLDEQIAAVKRFISASVSHADYYGPDNLHPDTAAMRAVLATLEDRDRLAARRAAEAVERYAECARACWAIVAPVWALPKTDSAAAQTYAQVVGEMQRIAQAALDRSLLPKPAPATPPPGDAGERARDLALKLAMDRGSPHHEANIALTLQSYGTAAASQARAERDAVILRLTRRLANAEQRASQARRVRYARCCGPMDAAECQRIMRAPLYQLGDAILVWVNEGDILASGEEVATPQEIS